jgi:hypothetical protein
MSLDSFLGITIVRSEPLPAQQAGDAMVPAGTLHDVHVATVRDVAFDRTGAVQSLIVEAAPVAANRAADRAPEKPRQHSMAVRDVRWRAEGMVLVTELGAAQMATLPPFETAEPATAGSPSRCRQPTTVLGSALLSATPTRLVRGDRIGVQPPTIWLAPAAQQLAFLAIPLEKDDHRIVPWGVVNMTASGDRLLLDLGPAAEDLAGAPRVKDAVVPPSASEREACCRHFGVPRPAWDEKPVGDGSSAARR